VITIKKIIRFHYLKRKELGKERGVNVVNKIAKESLKIGKK